VVVARVDEISESGSLGDWLQSARLSRGESLDDVARITRIGKSYLEAIEQGELHKLPSEAYAKGFIRLYATHLGLSGDEAVARLQGGVEPVAGKLDEPAPRTAVSSAKGGGRGYRRWVIPVTLLFFLIVISLIPRQKNRLPEPKAPVADVPGPQPGAEQSLPAASPIPAGGQSAPAPPPPAAEAPAPASDAVQSGGIILRLKAVQPGKLHITIDGAVSQEYDLNVGDLVEWKAASTLLLDLDNAGSVEAELNGKALKPFGEQGRAAHLVVRADGVHQE